MVTFIIDDIDYLLFYLDFLIISKMQEKCPCTPDNVNHDGWVLRMLFYSRIKSNQVTWSLHVREVMSVFHAYLEKLLQTKVFFSGRTTQKKNFF